MPVPNAVSDMTQTAATNSPAGSETVAPNLDNYLRALSSFIRQDQAIASATIAAASTVDLTNTDGKYVIITGAATITSLGVGFIGEERTLYFNASGSILSNSSNLVLPYAANITVIGGDNFTFRCTAASMWQLVAKGKVYSADVIGALGYTPPTDSSVVHITGAETISGAKTFSAVPIMSAGWVANATSKVWSGSVNTQQSMLAFGWSNNISRWQHYIESDGSYSIYAYDTSGTNPAKALQLAQTVAGGAAYIQGLVPFMLSTGPSSPVILQSAYNGVNRYRMMANVSEVADFGLEFARWNGSSYSPQLTITNGIATFSGTAFVTANAYEVGYRKVPLVVQNAAYALTAADSGRCIQHTDTTTYTYTVNNSIFTGGDVITVLNDNASAAITIASGTGVTLYLAGTGTTGNRTLAARGLATIYMASASVGYVSGSGVT